MPSLNFHLSGFRITALCWLLIPLSVLAQKHAQKTDTAKVYSITEVTVTERYRDAEIRSSAPLQILSAKQIDHLNVLQVSDAVKYFSGVSVKDYGGIGGLKTVSVRSLGANHTAVSYDGITLTDCQSGQIDIGRFSLDNVDMLSLSNGQSDNIFQPARLFASASVLNIRTLSPKFEGKKVLNGKVTLKGGSFGLLNPAVWLQAKINQKLSASVSAELLTANGEYPYLLEYGLSSGDSTSHETRKNTDVHNLRLEGAMYANFSDKESGYLKSYFYSSRRGLPGATIFYNVENLSSQRLEDQTFFTQGHYEKEFSKLWSFQTNAKYNRGFMYYYDPTSLNSDGQTVSTYLQQEYYGSASALFRAFENLSFSASTDGAITTLDATASPVRYTWLSDIATKYVTNNILATASLLGTVTNETVKSGTAFENQQRLSPFVSFAIKPFKIVDLRLRAFYKNIFRLPTFNDLYYFRVGNPDLKPEDTNQYNLGLTYSASVGNWLQLLSITADVYLNDVNNKIIAYPTKNAAVWTTLNLGKVTVDGLDLTAETTINLCKKVGLTLGTTYTYQRALNVTDPNDPSTYNNQLPYTPRISGSGRAAFETPWINVSYSFLWSGHRYAGFQNYAENRLPGYTDHSISFSHNFQLNQMLMSANVEMLNLLDVNYAIVRFFPMPGRSVRATLAVKF
jgi:vitamin B12 transporter